MKYYLIFLLVFLTSVFGSNISKNQSASPDLEQVWWGPKSSVVVNDNIIRPFVVKFEKDVITDLKQRLKNHRPVTPPLEGVGFEYGFNTNDLDYWVQYWVNDYDFSAREKFLNKFPQFKTSIQGLDIHFLWVRPQVPPNVEVVPLLFLHGWPGTVRELYEAIELLIDIDKNRDFALEIIAPSLPGFGFSDSAVRPGLGATEMAVVMRNLMNRLEFKRFYIQGGDWGSRVGSSIASFYPEEVLGYHTNLAMSRSPLSLALWLAGSFDQSAVVNPALADRLYPVKDIVRWLLKETGYMHLQATKPDSLGVAMSDSPAGLLAYLLQLISSGTRKGNEFTQHGGLEDHYSRDGLLDILTIIWISNSFATSCRIYAESMNMRNYNSNSLDTKPTPVPTWSVHAKDEIFYETPVMLRFKYPNLLHSTVLAEGGHFLAFERPKVFAEDVLRAIGAFRKWHETNMFFKDEL